MLSGEIVQRPCPTTAALVLAAIVSLPTVIFSWMPAQGPDRRPARESFPQFFAEVISRAARDSHCHVLFIAPASTFSLVNILGGLDHDFHTSRHFIGLVGLVACILLSLLLLHIQPRSQAAVVQ